MKVVLLYQRLPKPAGRWRYGLRLAVGVLYGDTPPPWPVRVPFPDSLQVWDAPINGAEISRLLTMQERSGEKYCLFSLGTWHHSYGGIQRPVTPWSRAQWPGRDLYFESSADRERMIDFARSLAREIVSQANWWLAAYNKPTPSTNNGASGIRRKR